MFRQSESQDLFLKKWKAIKVDVKFKLTRPNKESKL